MNKIFIAVNKENHLGCEQGVGHEKNVAYLFSRRACGFLG